MSSKFYVHVHAYAHVCFNTYFYTLIYNFEQRSKITRFQIAIYG